MVIPLRTLPSLVLALGLCAGGYFTGDGLVRAKLADRAVTVRGLSERDVEADLATWTLSYAAHGSELDPVREEVDTDTDTILAFLRERKFPEDEITLTGAGVSEWIDSASRIRNVTIRRRVTLRTRNVAAAQRAFQDQFELVRKGIALEEGSSVFYSFTGLDKIKPEMIAEATRDARAAAQQFARDSGSRVGRIRRATQGYFSVGEREGSGGGMDSPHKQVRVVTTVEFYLE